MTPAPFALLLAAGLAVTTPEPAPEAGGVETYARRVALAAADDRCALFSGPERALLDALSARSRDDAARAGDTPRELDRFEARQRDAAPACASPEIQAAAEAHRNHADALASMHEITFPGERQDWISERRDRGAPLWRVRQADRAREAVLGVHAAPDGDVTALALRNRTSPAFAVMVMRDPARQAAPLDFTAGGLLAAPFDDALSAWGGASGAQRRITASGRLDAETAARLAPAGGADAYAFTFPDRALHALRELTPREGVRIDLIDARGALLDQVWFEVGMINAALAVQALPLPAPEPTPAPAVTAAR